MSRLRLLPRLALALALCGCERGVPAAPPAAVHRVLVVVGAGRYAFEPSEVRLRTGDVLRFVHTAYQPESVAFDTAHAPPGGAAWLRDRHLTEGPLLTRPGQSYDVSFADAPPGRYGFASASHRRVGMRGIVVVDSAATR